RVFSIESPVNLCEHRRTYSGIAIQEPHHDAAAFGEVLDTSNKSSRVGEGMRVSSNGDVGAHVPNLWLFYFPGNCKPNHEISDEVENCSDGENHPRRSYLVD